MFSISQSTLNSVKFNECQGQTAEWNYFGRWVSSFWLDIFHCSSFYQTLGYLSNWPKLVHKFETIYNSQSNSQSRAIINLQPQRDQSGAQFGARERQHFHAGLEILERVSDASINKDYAKIVFNFQILIFSLWWFGLVWANSLSYIQ